jgi:thiamine pyrophosphokinase
MGTPVLKVSDQRKLRVGIIANAPTFDIQGISNLFANSDLVIATDGAANRLTKDFAPQIVCGDFDSIDEIAVRDLFPATELVCNRSQESNDLEKCIKLALERGASEIAISCAMGGRMDHTLTTLSLVERYHSEVQISLYEGDLCCRVFSSAASRSKPIEIISKSGDTVSLIPRGDGARVSLSNVLWPLNREVLSAGSRGVSNRATAERVVLTVHEGVVFFFNA